MEPVRNLFGLNVSIIAQMFSLLRVVCAQDVRKEMGVVGGDSIEDEFLLKFEPG